jgi:ribonucleoside-diphosphate reductase alpha chain
MPATKLVSKGLTRGIQPNVFVVRGNTALAFDAIEEAAAAGNPEAAMARLKELRSEMAATMATGGVVATETVTHTTAVAVGSQTTLTMAELRQEARVRGYEGENCQECGNFTLVRNGTCLKCDTCGGTSGCS